jgi:hypothetical protein
MKLSIFPEVLAHPVGKQQKDREAFKTSNPYMPEVLAITNEQQLMDVVSSYAWSASVFRGFRLKANFHSADFIAIDVDDGLTIDEAMEICEREKLTSLCLPSPSYTHDNQRFRIIFPLETTISDQRMYDATWSRLREIFPMLDASCSDASRFFYGCRTDMDVGFWLEAELLRPVIPPAITPKRNNVNQRFNYNNEHVSVDTLGEVADIIEHLYKEPRNKIPEAVAFFLEKAHTGIEGGWWNALNKFAFVLSLQGCDYDDIIEVVEQLAPQELDDRDMKCIDYAYQDGVDCRDDEEVL